nr:hypothetical protein [Tanacetum cinerariifolium]
MLATKGNGKEITTTTTTTTITNGRKWPGFTLPGQLTRTVEPLPEQQTRETKTTRGTHLPDLVVDKKGIIGMNVQKQETRPEATRIREAKMEESMVKETKMGIKLAKTLAS